MEKLFPVEICTHINSYNATHRELYDNVLAELEDVFYQDLCHEQTMTKDLSPIYFG